MATGCPARAISISPRLMGSSSRNGELVLISVRIPGFSRISSSSIPRAMRFMATPSRPALRAQGVGPPDPVGLGDEGHVAVEMTGRHRQVDGFDRIAGEQVDAIETRRHAHEIAEVLETARPAPAVEVGDVGRAGHGRHRDPVPAQDDAALRIPGVKRELRRRHGHPLHDEAPVETHAHCVLVHVGPGPAVEPAGRRPPSPPCRAPRGRRATPRGRAPARRPTGPPGEERGFSPRARAVARRWRRDLGRTRGGGNRDDGPWRETPRSGDRLARRPAVLNRPSPGRRESAPAGCFT